MATVQTGVSSSKVLILLGAGLTGSAILRSGHLSDVLSEVQELMKGISDVEISPKHYDSSLLAAQIRQLAQEVRELKLSKPVAIFNENSESSGSLVSYVMPAAAIGAMGYCYMWWKSAKQHLTKRLEALDGKVDEQKEASNLIMSEVCEVKSDLSQIGFDVETIQKMVSGLEEQIGLIESRQDFAVSGIRYLCQVAGDIKNGVTGKAFQETSAKLPLDDSTTIFSEEKSLKGLQFITESLESGMEKTRGRLILKKNNAMNRPSFVRL
ncbi:hypothetical protein QJS10_CPB15g01523 [Acorus calamus]|uniref:DUF1664 domain-containing protein n=1 Tax=Acorus calamus TaxID=4465 RepID=A0AAV9D9P6_ACOCL|nr:hypothetical protein QJS10_CPB15g01523 [Acorus calamus]